MKRHRFLHRQATDEAADVPRGVAEALARIVRIDGDAMSDALGIHLAEEADPDTDHGHVWSGCICDGCYVADGC